MNKRTQRQSQSLTTNDYITDSRSKERKKIYIRPINEEKKKSQIREINIVNINLNTKILCLISISHKDRKKLTSRVIGDRDTAVEWRWG